MRRGEGLVGSVGESPKGSEAQEPAQRARPGDARRDPDHRVGSADHATVAKEDLELVEWVVGAETDEGTGAWVAERGDPQSPLRESLLESARQAGAERAVGVLEHPAEVGKAVSFRFHVMPPPWRPQMARGS